MEFNIFHSPPAMKHMKMRSSTEMLLLLKKKTMMVIQSIFCCRIKGCLMLLNQGSYIHIRHIQGIHIWCIQHIQGGYHNNLHKEGRDQPWPLVQLLVQPHAFPDI